MADKNISRMHVRMEKAVAENPGEENFNPAFRQQFHVGAVLSSAATSETGMPYIRSITIMFWLQ